MNPSTGSFISMDSYTGSIYDPASLHRYTYVKDNSVMYRDPSGYISASLAGTSIALGIREVLNHVVELNCIGILNSIINATAATLMGSTEDEMLKALFSGYILGAGMAGLAYFVGAVYALTFAQVMLAEMAAGEAASFVMMVVSAFDGDSSSVVQYEIMNMLYFMSATLMYSGSLPKNDITPSKNGWNCDVENAGLAKVGADFGKMGIYVENPNITVDWSQYAEHAMERMQKRGMTKEMVDQIVLNGKTLSQDNGNKFVFITQKGVAVVSKNGKLITAWSSNNFDDAMREIIKRLFGE